jgi:EAL domain-containing protein (putative c-di-GMP-specific phosphodiesterase class I)
VTELTAAIVQVARIFKLKAVAEGIESSGQLEQLRGISCDYGQGFHFAAPLSAEEVMAMARGERGRDSADAAPSAAPLD